MAPTTKLLPALIAKRHGCGAVQTLYDGEGKQLLYTTLKLVHWRPALCRDTLTTLYIYTNNNNIYIYRVYIYL